MKLWFLALSFWMVCVLHHPGLILLFSIGFGLCSLYFIKDKNWYIFYIILMGFSLWISLDTPIQAHPGQYQIIEIKEKYCLATNKENTIVLYGLEDPNYYDVVEVKEVEKITSLKNLNVFQFETYMHHQKIDYQAQVSQKDMISYSHSLQSRLYAVLKSQPLYRHLFYQQKSEDTSNIIQRLGLPIVAIFSFLRKQVKRFSTDIQRIILIGCMGIYMLLFPVPISLIRYFIFLFVSLFCADRERRLSFSILLFLLLQPLQATSFVFVFPTLWQLVYLLPVVKKYRWGIQKCLLLVCQFIYFHEVDFLFLFLFQPLRKIYGWFALFSLCPLLRKFIFFLYPIFQSLLETIPHFIWIYTPGFLFYLCIVLGVWKRKLVYAVCLCLLPFLQYPLDPFFHVYMIDVGQGDCTLVVEPFRKSVVMIDCAGNLYRDNVEEIILPFLQSIQIHSIDALIVTHDDFDHSGGVEKLVESMEVKEVITNPTQLPAVSYPFYSLNHYQGDQSENDKSIVSYFSYDGLNYLWMGDAGVQVEEEIMEQYDLKVDILKLGHHGSDTSSGYSFLEKLRPKLGLVSVGAKNKYHHPSNRVISDCLHLGIHTLETKDVGMIHIFSFHTLRFFECGNGIFGIMGS